MMERGHRRGASTSALRRSEGHVKAVERTAEALAGSFNH